MKLTRLLTLFFTRTWLLNAAFYTVYTVWELETRVATCEILS